MEIAQYKGRTFNPSRIIEFLTRGPYSHSAFHFDEHASVVAAQLVRSETPMGDLRWISEGSVVEAWPPKLRSVESLSAQHDPGTVVDIFGYDPPLSGTEEAALIRLIIPEIGTPYDWKDVLRFVTRRRPKPEDLERTWFCSEFVTELSRKIGRPFFNQTESWEVPPSWVQRTRALKYLRTETTT